ncbi:MAG: glucose sorbosone dehydrogenase [Phycisphaeraceae bacterium]|nr:glucose sorbosone dehydrogenase [Phycisphaeraceae bacterium]
MPKHFMKLFVVLCFLSPAVIRAQDLDTSAQLFLKNCAACHGLNLQGGNARSMLDDQWEFAKDRASMAKVIRDGIAERGMPAHGNFSTQQINGLVQYIQKTVKDYQANPTGSEPKVGQTVATLKGNDYTLKVEQWVAGLKIPWAICFLDPTTMLITERPGGLRLVKNGILDTRPIANTPEVWHNGQGGMLDVNVDPDYPRNKWIYLSYSHKLEDQNLAMTRVVRGKIVDHQWTDQQVLFEAPHDLYKRTRHHYGSRIVFPPDGYLYFSIGERGYQNDAQDITKPNGKIHRINRDGSIPDDNPFVNEPNAIKSIYTFGNRNPQGLSVHPVTGRVWESEHGPRGGDELNLIQKGANYGWPEVTFGINYNGTPITPFTTMKGMVDPIIHWTPSIAVCGIEFYNGDLFTKWKNHLLVTALAFQEVRIVKIEGEKVTDQEVIIKRMGRVRDAAVGPDGAIYIATNGPDRILRLVPGIPGIPGVIGNP